MRFTLLENRGESYSPQDIKEYSFRATPVCSTHRCCLECFAHLEGLDDEHHPSNKRPTSRKQFAHWSQRVQDDQQHSQAHFEQTQDQSAHGLLACHIWGSEPTKNVDQPHEQR